MAKNHHYQATVEWTGNFGEGTKNYKSYSRNYKIIAEGKPSILGSSDPSFRGDASRYNPEDLFVSSLSSCQMLWYLHLCSVNKVTVLRYIDKAEGIMEEQENGSGAFKQVTLKPTVVIQEKDKIAQAKALHQEAHKLCFIANSVNFPVFCTPFVTADEGL